ADHAAAVDLPFAAEKHEGPFVPLADVADDEVDGRARVGWALRPDVRDVDYGNRVFADELGQELSGFSCVGEFKDLNEAALCEMAEESLNVRLVPGVGSAHERGADARLGRQEDLAAGEA